MALALTGVDTQNVNCGSNASIDDIFASPGGTVCGWIYIDTWANPYYDPMFIKANPDEFNNSIGGWGFGLTGWSGFNSVYFDHGFAAYVQAWRTPIDSIALDTWYHIAATFDRSSDANDSLLYINGVSQTTTETITTSGAANSDAAYDLMIGVSPYPADEDVLDGMLADIRLYNQILNANEIKTIYESKGVDGVIEGLQARYLLNEDELGTTPTGAGVIKDMGTSLNHGTPAGTVTYASGPGLASRRVV